jgi:hypothetical protein
VHATPRPEPPASKSSTTQPRAVFLHRHTSGVDHNLGTRHKLSNAMRVAQYVPDARFRSAGVYIIHRLTNIPEPTLHIVHSIILPKRIQTLRAVPAIIATMLLDFSSPANQISHDRISSFRIVRVSQLYHGIRIRGPSLSVCSSSPYLALSSAIYHNTFTNPSPTRPPPEPHCQLARIHRSCFRALNSKYCTVAGEAVPTSELPLFSFEVLSSDDQRPVCRQTLH